MNGRPSDLRFRKVKLEDAAGVIRILNPIIRSGKGTVLTGRFTVRQEREFIRKFPGRGVFNIVEDAASGKILGFQTLEAFATYSKALSHVAIIGTYVGGPYRGLGIGRKLAEHTFEAARKKGFEKILTFIRADNKPAIRFYSSLGFKTLGVARKQAKIGRKYVHELIVEKFL